MHNEATVEADVVIVGGGIIGFAIAHFLGAAKRVVLLEAESNAGYHSTGRSAAVLVEAYEGPVVRALTGAARRYLEAHGGTLSETPLLSPMGHLVIARADQMDQLRGHFAGMADIADRVRLIDGAEALAICPMLRPDAVAGALWEWGSQAIDVDLLLQSFIRSARRQGVRVLYDRRVDALDRDGELWRLRCGAATVTAPVVVNAAGAWAGVVGKLAGAAALSLEPRLRTALLVDPPAGADITTWPFVVTLGETVYFKPDAGRLMVSPADETPSPPADVWADDYQIAVTVERLQEIADIDVQRVPHSWAGLRTFAPDRLPVLGFDPVAPGFCWAAGLGGFGVQTSAAIGALVAAEILGQPPALEGDLSAVRTATRPDRFGPFPP